MSMRNKQCIIRLKPRVSLKKCPSVPSLASNKKGRVETIQHQQTKKKQLEILPGRMVP